MHNQPNSPGLQPPPLKKRGLSTVAIVFIIIGIIAVGLIVGGTIMVMSTVKDFKNMFEPTSRVTTYVPTKSDKQALEKKVAALEKVKNEGGEYTFIITPSDVNTYIAEKTTDKEQDMEPRIHFDIQGNILSGMISIPITSDNGELKFFNGEARFTAELIGDKLDVRLKEVLIKGKKPSFFINFIINQFKKENLVKEIYRNSKHSTIAEQLQYCKNLEIKDGKATITLNFPKPTSTEKNVRNKSVQAINSTGLNINNNVKNKK